MRRSELEATGQKVGAADFVKNQRVTILGFAGQMVSDVATELCCCRVRTAMENT